jgi:hypothetical protein
VTATIAPVTERPATPPPPVPLVGPARYTQILVLPVAVTSVLLIGLNRPLAFGASTALVPTLLLLPVCVSAVAGFRYARALLLVGFLAVAGGAAMALASPYGHAVNQRAAVSQALMILTAVVGVAVLLWVGRVLGMEKVALLYGLGAVAGAALDPARWDSNPWKFAFAFPVTVIVLALLTRWRRIIPQVLTLGVLGIVSVLLDYRSFFGFCVLTGVLLLWQQIGGWRPPRHKAGSVIVVGGLGLAMYYGGTALLVDGALGPELQERSEAQIEASGSLLLGGRPEWSGTVNLMAEHPWGYGLGVRPDTADVKAIKAGFAGINVEYDNGYVERFMAGDSFKLHSIVADLWAYCGVFGILLCATIVLILLGAFVTRFATRTGTPLFLFMALLALWDLAFGPSYSNLPDVTLATALALVPPAAALRRRSDRLAARRAFRVQSRRVTSSWLPPSRRGNAGDLSQFMEPAAEERRDPERTQFVRREQIPGLAGAAVPVPVPERPAPSSDATQVLKRPALRPPEPDEAPAGPDAEPTEVLARPAVVADTGDEATRVFAWPVATPEPVHARHREPPTDPDPTEVLPTPPEAAEARPQAAARPPGAAKAPPEAATAPPEGAEARPPATARPPRAAGAAKALPEAAEGSPGGATAPAEAVEDPPQAVEAPAEDPDRTEVIATPALGPVPDGRAVAGARAGAEPEPATDGGPVAGGEPDVQVEPEAEADPDATEVLPRKPVT